MSPACSLLGSLCCVLATRVFVAEGSRVGLSALLRRTVVPGFQWIQRGSSGRVLLRQGSPGSWSVRLCPQSSTPAACNPLSHFHVPFPDSIPITPPSELPCIDGTPALSTTLRPVMCRLNRSYCFAQGGTLAICNLRGQAKHGLLRLGGLWSSMFSSEAGVLCGPLN